jgi:hypothetical protein
LNDVDAAYGFRQFIELAFYALAGTDLFTLGWPKATLAKRLVGVKFGLEEGQFTRTSLARMIRFRLAEFARPARK